MPALDALDVSEIGDVGDRSATAAVAARTGFFVGSKLSECSRLVSQDPGVDVDAQVLAPAQRFAVGEVQIFTSRGLLQFLVSVVGARFEQWHLCQVSAIRTRSDSYQMSHWMGAACSNPDDYSLDMSRRLYAECNPNLLLILNIGRGSAER